MPGKTPISKLQDLSGGAISFSHADASSSWPARGRVETGFGPVDVDVYIQSIGGSGRDRPTERRFQNPASTADRPIVEPKTGYALLLGLWTEKGDDHAVVVAMDAYRRLNRNTRFSLFMPLSLLVKADNHGQAQSENANGEILYAFKPEHIGSYVDKLVGDREEAKTAPFPSTSSWDSYRDWNYAIADHFFSTSSKNKLVYLDLDDKALTSLGQTLALDTSDLRQELTDAVLQTLDIERRGGSIFHPHLSVLSRWRKGVANRSPPCLALLAFFASIAEEMRADESFASTNYYGRLGLALGLESEDEIRTLGRDFRTYSTVFWDALNSWLEEADGEFGLPTAFAFDRRRFVSIPISQALVREKDRIRLIQCFDNFGLRPGQRLASSDMERVLADWLPDSNVSSALKTLWRTKDARRKISEIAALELEAWDGTSNDEGRLDHSRRNLLLAIHQRTQPRLSFNFAFIVQESDALKPGQFSFIESALESSITSKSQVVTVSEALFPGYLTVSSSSGLNVGRTLLSDVRLKPHGSTQALIKRRWKPIIVLRFDRGTNLYIETKRVELAERHIVMCHQTITNKVRTHLDKISSDYYDLDQTRNANVPKNWTLFGDVRIAGICSFDSDDLQSLVPVASTNIVLDGGLALPTRNTWHSRHPPTLQVATLSDNECEAELLCVQDLANPDAETSSVSLGRFNQSESFDLALSGMLPGDYRVVVTAISGRSSNVIASAAVRLRNSEHRRTVEPLHLGHFPQEQSAAWALSAISKNDSSDDPVMISTSIENWPNHRSEMPVNLQIPSALSERIGEKEHLPHPPAISSSDDELETPSCIARGHHIWELPPEEISHPSRQTLLGSCKDCGLEKWFGGHLARRRGRPRKTRPHADFEPRVIEVSFLTREQNVSADTLFDALCHIGAANRRAVANLVDSFSNHPWMTDEVLRALSALGHIEVAVNPLSSQITDWEISGSALNYADDGMAFLTGYRTPSLVARLREDASAIGVQFRVDRQPAAPSRISVLGIGEQDIADLADSISQSTGILVSDCIRPSQAIASRLPDLSELVKHLPTSPLSSSPCQHFDLNLLKWIDVDKPERPGAYRFRTWTWSYAFVDEQLLSDGLQRCGDYRTIKHIAAAESGSPLIAFDETSRKMTVPLGAELPWLYERAVTLESGLAPISKTNGQVEYSYVSKAIAELVWSAMLS